MVIISTVQLLGNTCINIVSLTTMTMKIIKHIKLYETINVASFVSLVTLNKKLVVEFLRLIILLNY